MKILKKEILKKGKNIEGYVLLKPFDNDDIWYIYNIICLGDFIECKVRRKIVKEGVENKKKKAEIKIVTMLASILKIDFLCDENGTSLILKMKNIRENDYINKGSIQTVEVKLNQKIKIIKQHWDIISLRNLDDCKENSNKSETLIILMEEGLANIYFLKTNYSIFRSKIEKSIPKKKGVNNNNYKTKIEKFYDLIIESLELINKKEMNIKCLLLAGPGIAKENFKKYIVNKYNNVPNVDKEFKATISSSVLVPTSNVYKTALEEIIKNSNLKNILKDFKAYKEINALELFYGTLRKSPNLAVYGFNDVSKAVQENAIKLLLISDNLFKNTNFVKRKQYIDLVKKSEKKGKVIIFNKMLPSGLKLEEMTGIAAILNFEIKLNEESDNSDSELNDSFDEDQVNLDIENEIQLGYSQFDSDDGNNL